MEKDDIMSLDLISLKEKMAEINEKSFRANQIYEWLHVKLASSFDEMTNLSKSLRDKLQENLPSLSEDEQAVYSLLKTLGVAHVAELSQQSGLPMYKASALLSALEIKGLIVKTGGNNYQIV